jgi:hypothetical protein
MEPILSHIYSQDRPANVPRDILRCGTAITRSRVNNWRGNWPSAARAAVGIPKYHYANNLGLERCRECGAYENYKPGAEVHSNPSLTVHDHGALGVSAQGKSLIWASSRLSCNMVGGKSGAGCDSRAVLCARVVGDRVRSSSLSTEGLVSFGSGDIFGRTQEQPTGGTWKAGHRQDPSLIRWSRQGRRAAKQSNWSDEARYRSGPT